MELGERNDRGLLRRNVPRHNGLARADDLRADHHGIDPGFRARAMGAVASDLNVEQGTARHHRSGANGELSSGQAGTVVHAENCVAGELIEQAVRDHRFGTSDSFFRRLENEMDAAFKISRFRQIARGSQQHCRVTIMAAGVHFAVISGPVREGVGFQDRKSVHIRAQSN